MVKLTDEMKAMLKEQLCYVATASRDGVPNIGPKRSGRFYSDNQIIWNETTDGRIIADIEAGSKVAIAIANWDKLKGFRFVGTAEIFREGDGDGKAYQDCVEKAPDYKMAKFKAAVVVTIEKIYLLDSGPKAGTLIAE